LLFHSKSELFTALKIYIILFWNMSPYSLLNRHQYFGRTCYSRCWNYIFCKHQCTRSKPHGVTSQKTAISIFIMRLLYEMLHTNRLPVCNWFPSSSRQ